MADPTERRGGLVLALVAVSLGLVAPNEEPLQLVVGVSAGRLPDAVHRLLTQTSLKELRQGAEEAGATVFHCEADETAVVVVGDPFALAPRRRRAALAEFLARSKQAGHGIDFDKMDDECKLAMTEFLSQQVEQHLGVKAASASGASFATGISWVVTLEHDGRKQVTGLSDGQADLPGLQAVRSEPLPNQQRPSPQAQSRPGYPASTVQFTVADHATAVARRARAISKYLAEVEKESGQSYERIERAADMIEQGSKLAGPRQGGGFESLDIEHQKRLMENRLQHYAHYGFQSPEAATTWLSSARLASVRRDIMIRVKVRMPDGTFQGFQTSLVP